MSLIKRVNPRSDLYFVLWLQLIVYMEQLRKNENVEVTFKYVIGSYWTDTSQTTFSTDPQYQISPIFVVQYSSYLVD